MTSELNDLPDLSWHQMQLLSRPGAVAASTTASRLEFRTRSDISDKLRTKAGKNRGIVTRNKSLIFTVRGSKVLDRETILQEPGLEVLA